MNAETSPAKRKVVFLLKMLLLLGILVMGLYQLYSPTLQSGFSRMQSDPIDTRLNHYFLEHSFRWAFDREYSFSLWSPPFYYPAPNVLALSDNLLGTAPFYWFLRAFLPPLHSYQGWLIGISSLSFAAAYFFFRKLGVNFLLSLAGAYSFAFGLQILNQVGHPQLLGQIYAPLALLYYLDFLRTPRTRPLFFSLIFIALQLAAGIYLGWFLGVGLLVFTGCYVMADLSTVSRVWDYFRKYPFSVLAVCLPMLLVMLLFLLPYLRMSAQLSGGWGFETVQPFLYPFKAWWAPNSLSKLMAESWGLSPALSLPEGPHSLGIFGGVLFLSALAGAFFLPKEGTQRIFIRAVLGASVLLVLFSISLPNGFSAWKLMYKAVPGASAIRAVNRIWTVVYLFWISGGILSLSLLIRKWKIWKQLLLGAALLSWGVLENIPRQVSSFDPAPYSERISVLSDLIRESDVAYITASPERNGAEELLDFMWAGMLANTPVVNGTSSRPPPEYPEDVLNSQTHHLLAWFGDQAPQTLTRVYPESLRWEDSYLGMSDDPQRDAVMRKGGFVRYDIPIPLPESYGQRFVFIDPPASLQAGSKHWLTVAIENTGSFTWGHQWPDLVQASGRWFDSEEQMLSANPPRTPLPRPQIPREWVVVSLEVDVPDTPGTYRFEPTMVWESVAWFRDRCEPDQGITVQVLP